MARNPSPEERMAAAEQYSPEWVAAWCDHMKIKIGDVAAATERVAEAAAAVTDSLHQLHDKHTGDLLDPPHE